MEYGVDFNTISTSPRHSAIRTMMDTYSHFTPKMTDRDTEAVDDIPQNGRQ
jgi:hypothetical protein